MENSDQVSADTDLVASSMEVDTLIGNEEAVKCSGEYKEKGVDLAPKTEVGSMGDLLVSSGDKETGDQSELIGRGGDEECANGDTDTGTPENGEGRRARKRRKVEISDKERDVVDLGGKTNCTGDNDNPEHVSSVEVPGCAKDSLLSPFEIKMEEKNGSEDSDHMLWDSVRVKGWKDKHNARSVGRVRKRRKGDSSVCNDSDNAAVKKVKGKPVDGKGEVIGRILRSRTVLMSGKGKMVNAVAVGGLSGGTVKEEAGKCLIENIQVERNGSAKSIGAEKGKMKGGRGRPRKADGEGGGEENKSDGLFEETIATEKVECNQLNGGKEKKNQKRGRGRPRKADGEVDREEDKSDDLLEGTIAMEKVECNQLNGRKKKHKKRGRGRPRKADGEVDREEDKSDVLFEETIAMEKVECDQLNGRKEKKHKKDGQGRRARPHAENSGEGNQENDNSCKESGGKEKIEAHQTISRRKKKQKGFGGRSTKAPGKVGGEAKKETPEMQTAGGTRSSDRVKKIDGSCEERSPKFQVGTRQMKVSGCQKKDQVSEKRGSHKDPKMVKQSKISTTKGGGELVSLRTEKQLLRERISAMLKSAGWTIEYRPRMSKEYLDAVYVCPEGKTHWSVTKAYKALKKQVEDGKADKRAVSVFTPLPDEEFSKLFRVTEKQRKLKGLAGGKGKAQAVSHKKSFKKKHVIGKIRGRKGKEKLGSSRNKQKPERNEDGSARKPQRGMRLSKREVKPNKKRFALLVRESRKGKDSENEGFEPCDRKISLLAWMIDLGTLPLNGKVLRMKGASGQGLLEGRITTDGILCDCCNNTFSISEFESHAGNEINQPFQNIYLESGTSLIQCLLDSWKKYKDSVSMGFHSVDIDGDDPNDDTCNICGDGGDLICCDGCPSTFHQNCLNIQNFPSGDWHCVYCSCKFCGSTGEGSGQMDLNCDIQASSLLTCRSCEQKYHQFCIPEESAELADAGSSSFCGKKCQEVFESLQVLLGVKHELEGGYSWTLIQRSEISHDIHSSAHQNIECNSKLAVAYSLMDECFLPILDERSGITTIRNVVFSCGSNFTRLNYSGFFTAILEKGDDMVSAASIRIHGNYLAEMPFIGTRHMYRRQGMCRRLLNAIESALCSLNIEKLVIPAISELHQTWTSVFGFLPLDESSKEVMKSMNMVVFPGVAMLQKPILKHKCPEDNNIISTAAADSSEPIIEQQRIHRESHEGNTLSAGNEFYYSRRVVSDHARGTSDLAAASGSALHLGDAPSNDAAEIASETVASQEPKTSENVDHSGVTRGKEECKSKAIKSDISSDATTSEGKISRAPDCEFRDPADFKINGEEKPDAILTSRVEDRENSISRPTDLLKSPQAELLSSLHNGHISVSGDCNDDTRIDLNIPCEIAGLSSAENTSTMSDVVGDCQTSCSEEAATCNDLHPRSADSLPSRRQISTNSPKKSDAGQGIFQVPEPLSLLCTSGSCNPTVTPEAQLDSLLQVKSSRSLRSGRLC